MKDRIYNSEDELLSHAKKLHGKSLFDLHGHKSKKKYGGKGGFGNKVEEVHYGIKNNNRSVPDVENLGIEIKTNPLKINKNGVVPAERISLAMINFSSIRDEKFESSSFIKKNKSILYNMFLRDRSLNDYNIKFILVDLISLEGKDLDVIKKDWNFIKNKAVRLKADELHEGDTDYLGAVTKGGKNQKKIPYSDGRATAKKRAFSFKPAYIRHLLKKYKIINKNGLTILIRQKKKSSTYSILEKRHNGNIEEATLERFNKFLGFSDFKISEKFNFQKSFIEKKDKSRWHWLTSYILTEKRKKFLSKHIDEFSKSGLTVKTIRVDKRNLPVEEISFKTLNYEKFENEKWEESNLFEEMSSKFLWVIYKIDDGKTILDNVFFWSMSLKDLDFIKMKWKEYTKFLKAGDFRSSYFMDEESFYYLKIKDKKGGKNKLFVHEKVTALSHWFRKAYVKEIIDSN